MNIGKAIDINFIDNEFHYFMLIIFVKPIDFQNFPYYNLIDNEFHFQLACT